MSSAASSSQAAHATQVTHADGRVELGAGVTLGDVRLFNEDLAPTKLAQRTWTTYTFAALWISMAHCIPTYMLASGLIKIGHELGQALCTILLGNSIVLAPILLNSHPGTKYGIPFPVFARAAYGVFGANVPAIMRAIVACGWFGIQCWIGGKALQRSSRALWSGWPERARATARPDGHLPDRVALLRDLLGHQHPHRLPRHGPLAARRELGRAVRARDDAALARVDPAPRERRGRTAWAASSRSRASFPRSGAFLPVFVPSVTAMVGFWATLSLNMPDFTRYGRSQREQALGQVVGAAHDDDRLRRHGHLHHERQRARVPARPSGIRSISARACHSRWLVAVAELTAVVATLAMNIAANVVSPANDFSNLAPSKISFRTGGLITGLLATLMMPWKLLENSDRYINGWLLGYSGGLGSIAGVLVCDYWLIRRTRLQLADLYRRDGVYAYGSKLGTNWPAVVATAVGCTVAWIGLFVPALHWLYDAAWFSGTISSGVVYGALMWKARENATPLAPRPASGAEGT